MSAAAKRPFELVPRRRYAGVQFGRRRSSRRGDGDEIAGTRPYQPGDRRAHIHWPASARESAAHGTDQFVVRVFFAEQAPRVVVVRDRRPAMAANPAPSPWLDKRAAVETIVELVTASAVAERAELAYADDTSRAPKWLPTADGSRRVLERRLREGYDGPDLSLRLGLEAVLRRAADLPVGSFVFVVSDFVLPLPARVWLRLHAACWEVVPVVVQDPTWEQTFPDVGGAVLPLADPATGSRADVWISRREARDRARANERRLDELVRRARRLGFDPVVVGSSDPGVISARFHAWAEERRRRRRINS